MRIRDEIAALEENAEDYIEPDIYEMAIADALSILNKWKLAVEYDAPVDVDLHIIGKCDNYADVGLSLDFEEGTHIVIYVRRGKEDE